MNKVFATTIGLLLFSLCLSAQTLGEKYRLPEEPGELRADGVYHLPASLLPDAGNGLEAYFRFFPDGTFIVYHSRVSPEANAQVFQLNCNYQYISASTAPFNRDYKLKSKGNISRARIVYTDSALLLKFDVRKDVIAAELKPLELDGRVAGESAEYVMPFYQVTWPVEKSD